ncbi:MAG TPA: LiaF domain-containing protein [Gemmatimonadaceae bacterium]|nr:LiaF domain-containing protein [Gemmatimonadaceae bacterium]
MRSLGRSILALAALAPAIGAQQTPDWRTITVQRQRHNDDSLRVRVDYGAGRLTIGAAAQPLLYDVHVRFDPARFRPRARYDASTRTLRVSSDSVGNIFNFGRHAGAGDESGSRGGGTPSDITVGLARGIPLDLRLQVGAAETEIDLSNLWVDRLHMQTGASDTRITFGTPNPKPMRELTIESGAAGMELRQAGNAHAERVRITTGAGDCSVDLAGDWTGTTQVDLTVVLGHVTLRVPRDAGVRVTLSKRIASVDQTGLVEKDGALESPDYASAKRKLVVDGTATVGGVDIEWGS